MSFISNFARSGMWDYKSFIVPAVVGVPLAIESAILAKNIYQKPHVIKEKLNAVKTKTIQSFTIQPYESRRDAISRIAKNVFIVLVCLALMGGAAYASILILPGIFAITTAISSIFFIGKLFLNAKEYKKKIIDMFSAREGEDPAVAKKRILKNIVITVIALTVLAVGIYFVAPMFTNGFTWQLSLPLQTKGVVFAEYASIGIVNGGLAFHKWKKGDKLGALYHLFVGALSFVFPAYYWNTEMRLHHSFYGLLFMSTPYRPLRMLGGMISFDSALYMIEPLRGYIRIDHWGSRHFEQYDFINTIVDRSSFYANGYAGSLILENINDNWTEEPRQPSMIEMQSLSSL